MAIHDAAAKGFAAAAAAYERGRPDYPAEAVSVVCEALNVGRERTIADIGAGTGKFTALIADRGAKLIAIEPVPQMRERLVQRVPGVTALDGTAEALPLEAQSIDGAIVAQAFHWFDAERALKELHRVLRPAARLALVWNVRDEAVPWMDALTRIINRHEKDAPRYRSGEWRRAFTGSALFAPVAERHFRHVQTGDHQMVLDRVASISFIGALPDSERAAVLDEVRALLGSTPETKEAVSFPYVTDVFIFERSR